MTGAEEPDAAEEATKAAAERRRRLAEVFGDVLPEQTSDDADADSGEPAADGRARDDWLRGEVPPHHGG